MVIILNNFVLYTSLYTSELILVYFGLLLTNLWAIRVNTLLYLILLSPNFTFSFLVLLTLQTWLEFGVLYHTFDENTMCFRNKLLQILILMYFTSLLMKFKHDGFLYSFWLDVLSLRYSLYMYVQWIWITNFEIDWPKRAWLGKGRFTVFLTTTCLK